MATTLKPKRSSSPATARSNPSSPSDLTATARQEGRRLGIRPNFPESRAANPTDHDDIPDAQLARPVFEAPGGADPYNLVRRGENGRMVGVPLQRKDEIGPVRLFAGFNGQRRDFAAAGDDGERSGRRLSHWSPAAGRSAVPDRHG